MTVFFWVLTFRERERVDGTDVRQMNRAGARRPRILIFCSRLKAEKRSVGSWCCAIRADPPFSTIPANFPKMCFLPWISSQLVPLTARIATRTAKWLEMSHRTFLPTNPLTRSYFCNNLLDDKDQRREDIPNTIVFCDMTECVGVRACVCGT